MLLENIFHNCSKRGMNILLQAESHSRVWLHLCAYAQRLTLINWSVNAIIYSCKFNFPTVTDTKKDRLFSLLSRILTGSRTINRRDTFGNVFVCSVWHSFSIKCIKTDQLRAVSFLLQYISALGTTLTLMSLTWIHTVDASLDSVQSNEASIKCFNLQPMNTWPL